MKKTSKHIMKIMIALFCLFAFINPIYSYANDTIITKQVIGDLDGNGTVDSVDYALMKKFILQQITNFPISNQIISNIDDINATITQNSSYNLPNNVEATMANGSKRNVAVVWANNSVNTSIVGQYMYEGTVVGYGRKIKLTLAVTSLNATLATVNPVQLYTPNGVVPSLPATVSVVLSDGKTANAAIAWNNAAYLRSTYITPQAQTTISGNLIDYGNYNVTATVVITNSTDQSLVYNLVSEPKSIDPTLNAAMDGSNVINATFEGLTRITEKMVPGPGVAKSWDISSDGTTYTFHLRGDAKWSDGTPVTANDFYYSWSRLINPSINAPYSYQMFYIKNAENYFTGNAALSDVGFKVIDNLTFEVKLVSPTPYFLELCASSNFAPERADIVNANPNTWATNPQTYISNGPFKLTSWKHGDSLEFIKNTNYWNAKNTRLEKMSWKMINTNTSYMTAWENGSLDVIESPPSDRLQDLMTNGKLTIVPSLGTYGIYFNTQMAPFDNVKFRKAMSLAIDRDYITKTLLKGGQISAGAWVPPGIKEPDGKDFRDTPSQYYSLTSDVATAQQLLLESGVDTENLTLNYIYNKESLTHQVIAEALQKMWKDNLGVNVTITGMDWATFQATRAAGNYQIARAGWMGDYTDPMTFLDMWVSNSNLDEPRYANTSYDTLIAAAKAETDPVQRMKLLHEAEDLLMNTMPIAPIYFYTNTLCINPKLVGLYKTPSGIMYFDKIVVLGN